MAYIYNHPLVVPDLSALIAPVITVGMAWCMRCIIE